ncbi:hypothetical protein BBO_09407 [Beauveria brongniartii RCEF 3172]|uniref:Uncharacterized protein n=1 Tax=Beauveria brongniartii RCEF 3172 TaxID=1081107 RepID=A0A166VQP3_9HYPO|nr:hypothetical protein BBO_09407 [Beauveria brongniartii RCEF 3172]
MRGNGSEEIADYIERSKEEGIQHARAKHFMKMAFLAKQTSEAWKARVEASEKYDITSDREETASGKDDQDELKKERKSKKKETIEIEWRELGFRIQELDQERWALAEEREAFRELENYGGSAI